MSSSINTNYYNSSSLFGSSSSSINTSQYAQQPKKSNVYGDYNTYDVINLRYGRNNAKTPTTSQVNPAVTSAGSDLSKEVSSLTAKGTKSLFNKIAATSTDTKVAEATVDNAKFNTSKMQPVELNIQQIAKEQINSGDFVKSSEKAVSSGNYKFAIDVGGKKQEFAINVSLSDNNDAIQKKMATAINDSKMGVTASIKYDSTSKTGKLQVASSTTGNKNADGSAVFTISDTSGNLASKMGITSISQESQNAIYAINGEERKYSTSNKVDLGNGVTATLKEGGKSTTLNFKKDGTGSISAVKELVGTLNSALSSARGSSGKGSSRLASDITNMNKSYSGALSRIGITASDSGVLTVDDKKLQKAAEDGSLEKMFQQDQNYGFASRASRISDNMKSTNYYADQVTKTSQNSGYGNNPYASMSSLFDSYF